MLAGAPRAALADAGPEPGVVAVAANRLVVDARGVVVGAAPDDPITHANKAAAPARAAAWLAARPRADRLLVVGDSVGDAAVAARYPGTPRAAALGFFDPTNPWADRAAFQDAFDALLPADADLAWLADHLRRLDPAPPGGA